MEKSWSRQEAPRSHATSRSAKVTVSITAIPLRKPSQNRSAALRSSLWCSNVHVSTKTWSEVTSVSPDLRIAFDRALLRSEESAAAYQMEVSTNKLISRERYRRRGFLRVDRKASAIMESLWLAMSEPPEA